jgi:curli biogenesis system outer membrane secretion channel CsgG
MKLISLALSLLLLLQAAVPAIEATEGRVTVAVTDLQAQGVTQSDAAVISEQLRYQLYHLGSFTVLERNQMENILKEQGFQQTGCSSEQCAVEMGQLLGVKQIITGSIGKVGSYSILNVRFVDVATGKIIFNESEQIKGAIEEVLEKSLKNIVDKIRIAYSGTPEPQQKVPAAQAAAQPQAKSKSKTGTIVLVTSLSAVVVGGVVVAAILFGKKKEPGGEPAPNVDVVIPPAQ